MIIIRKFFKSIDFSVIAIIFVLFLIGEIALFSAGGGIEGNIDEANKHILWFIGGFVIMLIVAMIDYEVWRRLWIPLYAIMLLALFLVLFTEPINRSWFTFKGVSIQPSEFSKIILILGLASLLSVFKEKGKVNNIFNLLIAVVFLAIPTFLIVKQPDYGTAMVFLAIFAVMLFSYGISLWYVLGSMVALAAALPFVYLYILPEHAKERINVFLNPQSDPLGAGYNIIQSVLAVGSGKVWGMGLYSGHQTQLGYLPMKTTDFIYSVISEEMGFIISALVVLLFILLVVRLFYIAKNTKDMYGSLIVAGIAAMFLAHFIENVGMTIGLMPITGIPLPFVSYGGSSMLTNCIAIGLVLSVNRKRKKNMFME